MKLRDTVHGRRSGLRPSEFAVSRFRAWRGWLQAGSAVLVLALLTACGPDHLKHFPQTTFAPATDYARQQDWLFKYVLAIGVVVGVIVFALVAYVLVRFRYREDAPAPQQTHGNTTTELGLTFLPALILAFIAVPTVQKIFATQPQDTPPDAIRVVAVGKQWWFQFKYPVDSAGRAPSLTGTDTVVTANEIHVPVGRPVEILLKSDNVLHSFWIPQMGGKRDMIPNRVNKLIFTPEEPGVYYGQCAEFCGESHALMRMRLIAQTPEDFAAWLRNEDSPAEQPRDSSVALGRNILVGKPCVGCHRIDGVQDPVTGRERVQGVSGPNLTHFGRRRTMAAGIMENNAANLTLWLYNAPHVKPGSKMPSIEGLNLKPEEVPYVVAYLQSLQ